MERFELAPEHSIRSRMASRAARWAINHTQFEHSPNVLRATVATKLARVGRFLIGMGVRASHDFASANPLRVDLFSDHAYRRLAPDDAATAVVVTANDRWPEERALGYHINQGSQEPIEPKAPVASSNGSREYPEPVRPPLSADSPLQTCRVCHHPAQRVRT